MLRLLAAAQDPTLFSIDFQHRVALDLCVSARFFLQKVVGAGGLFLFQLVIEAPEKGVPILLHRALAGRPDVGLVRVPRSMSVRCALLLQC